MGRSLPKFESAQHASRVANTVQSKGQGIILPLSLKGGGGGRVVHLTGAVSEQSVAEVQEQILELAHDSNKPIQLIISTYGGASHEMFSLYDVMNYVSAPIHTTALGKVMSAGTLILAAGTKGHRRIGRSARVMIHSISSGVVGSLLEMEGELNEIRALSEMYVSYMSTESKINKDKLLEMLNRNVDINLSAEEAIALGLVDKLL